MSHTQVISLSILCLAFVIMIILAYCSNNYSLNGIKRKTVGNGQHGTARFATKIEIKKTYTQVPFDVESWRKGENLPRNSNGDIISRVLL